MKEIVSSLANFCEKIKLSLYAARWDHNPDLPYRTEREKYYHDEASHWLCQLRRGRQRMTLYFSQGSAHVDPPKLVDVMECLHLDASNIKECSCFEEFAQLFGLSSDSIQERCSYRKLVQQCARLQKLLGEHWEAFLQLEME